MKIMDRDLSNLDETEFWVLVGDLLSGGASPGELADYVTDEAERRDPELARIRRERVAVFAEAGKRAGDDDPLALDSPADLTPAEERAFRDAAEAYDSRMRELAASGGWAAIPGPDSDDAERHQFDKPADAKPDLDVPAVLAEVAAIIRRGAETGLPVPGYITYSPGRCASGVSFQFGTPYDVERWAFSVNEELTRTHYDAEPRGHTVYRFPLLTDDDSAIDCYCLVYDAEPVPGLAEHTAAACDTIEAASK